LKRKVKAQQKTSTVKNATVKLPQTVDPEKWKIYSALAVIVLITIISYLPVFHNGLLAWDDEGYIKNNPLVYSFNLKDIFSKNTMGNWHPLTILALAAEYHLFGLNPAGYHAVNLLLHILNVLLVFYVVYLISDKAPVAMVASLLFGIHPLHVESVAWAAELKDLLYTFFFLASYIYYLKYLNDRQRKHYILALLMFIVSLLSKAMAASLPLVLILTDYFKGRKIDKKTLIEKAPFFPLAIVFGVVAVIAQKSLGATELTTNFTFLHRIVFASYGFITYLFKLLLPLNLSAFYPYPFGGIPAWFYAYLLLFLVLAAYVIYSHRFSRKIIFGMGFFTITIMLVLQLLPVGKAIMADRYSYIPSIGIFYLAGEGLMYLWGTKLKWTGVVLLSAASVFFSLKTYARCGVWKDDMTLWNDVISRDQTAAEAFYNRGILFMKEKKNDEAIKDLDRVIELEPGFANSYNGRGVIFTGERRINEAIGEFNRAIELNPGYAEAYNNRGFILMNAGRIDEAVRDLNKAIELKEGYAEAYFNRGSAFVNLRRIDEAIKDLTRAVDLNPHYAEAYNNRGSVFVNTKRTNEALKDLNRAIELNSSYAEAYYNRGILFNNEKRYAEAFNDFTKAVELKPDYAFAYNNRGILLVNQKRSAEAISDFTRAIELKPDYSDAWNNRGYVYMNLKRNDEAIRDFNRAIEVDPGNIGAYNNKGMLLSEAKRYDEAVIAYSRIIEIKSDYAQAYYKRGIAAYNSGRKAAACADLKQAAGLGFKPAEEALSQICK
jgi:protein O-mannosyl-transferase